MPQGIGGQGIGVRVFLLCLWICSIDGSIMNKENQYEQTNICFIYKLLLVKGAILLAIFWLEQFIIAWNFTLGEKD